MARYTQLSTADIQEIGSRYHLAVVDFSPLQGGAANSSYFLHTKQGDYVLTVFDEKTKNAVIGLGNLLLRLEERGFPTTRVRLPSKSGLVTMYERKPILLKTFIPGHVCTTWNEALLKQVGAALACLHQVPVPDFLPTKHPYGQQAFSKVIGQNVHLGYESWLAERHSYLEQHVSLQLPHALIHGDLYYDNVLVEGQVFQAIIDFEEACHYYRVFDLGMAIIGLCMEGANICLSKARALVSGYEQGQTLEGCEREALQLFVEYAAIATSFWRFWKYYIHMPQPKLVNKPFEMVKLAEAVKTIPKAAFLAGVFE